MTLIAVIVIILAYFGFFYKTCQQISPPKIGQTDSNIVQKGDKLFLCQTFFEKLGLTQTKTSNNNGIVSGQSVIGPSCPEMMNPPEDECKDKPYPTTIIVKSQDGTKEITRVLTDKNGSFTISLPAGTYQLIGVQDKDKPYPTAKSTIATIEKGKIVTTTVSYDSGIR